MSSQTGVKVGLLALLLLMLGGCSIKFIYNNVDRFIRWEVNDLVDFDAEQTAYFNAQLAQVLYWHRKTQLPVYAELFASMPSRVADGIAPTEVTALAQQLEGWGSEIEQQVFPVAIQLLLSLSVEQANQLPINLKKANGEFLADERDKNLEQDQRRWRKSVAKNFRRFIGRLNREQKDYLIAQAPRYQSERALWVAYRQRWQSEMLELVHAWGRSELSAQEFADSMSELSKRRRDFYGEFSEVNQSNRDLIAQVSSWLLTNLSTKQRDRFADAMASISEDFTELAADLPEQQPPRVGCLVLINGC